MNYSILNKDEQKYTSNYQFSTLGRKTHEIFFFVFASNGVDLRAFAKIWRMVKKFLSLDEKWGRYEWMKCVKKWGNGGLGLD